MRKRVPRQKQRAEKKSGGSRRMQLIAASAVVLGCVALAVSMFMRRGQKPSAHYLPRPRGEITFAKHIAPIVFQNCAGCHRPGQSAPFPLLSYQDVRKHAIDIADVTARRYMPPWLPEPGYGEFVGERRLSADQIGMIQQWVAEAAVEGAAADLPPLPQWNADWQLGKPDLVVTMPEPYTLAAEGRDVYRNFVVPVPVTASRHVRGVEFHPGNPKIVHHAFVKLDRTAQSRRQDADDPGPGFGGMNIVAEMPGGHFLGWQPGRLPSFVPDGLAWRIDPGNDLVLQVHMNPTGKPEQLQSSVGIYFTDQPPTNTCFKMFLASYVIDIPAGARDYTVQDNFILPADVQVLGVFPHAHYLAKEMQGWATLPNGTRQWLLWIKQWDFNWQSDYRYARPLSLPKGTTLSMRFTYDNSTNNIRNPNHPLRPVAYGPQSSDEMAELGLQLLPANQRDYDLLAREVELKLTRAFVEAAEHKLQKNPKDADAHGEIGLILLARNQLDEAERHLRAAVESKPELAIAHYNLGLLFRRQSKSAEARAEFETTLRLDPKNSRAHGNLGTIFLMLGDLDSAASHFKSALRLNPDDALARASLDEIQKAFGRPR